MLTAYLAQDGRLVPGEGQTECAVWIDLVSPTAEEEVLVEGLLHVDIPTRDDMLEIEQSSRIYAKDGCLFLTAQIVASTNERVPEIGRTLAVRLVLAFFWHCWKPSSTVWPISWKARRGSWTR